MPTTRSIRIELIFQVVPVLTMRHQDHENCDTCGEERAEKKCSECKSADYCDQVNLLKAICNLSIFAGKSFKSYLQFAI